MRLTAEESYGWKTRLTINPLQEHTAIKNSHPEYITRESMEEAQRPIYQRFNAKFTPQTLVISPAVLLPVNV